LPEFDQVEDYDASDWWYRCRFTADEPTAGEEAWLRFEGLASLAQVWLNGEQVGSSENMFRPVAIEVTSRLLPANELLIRFRSLREELDKRRPRPGWRTNLVEHQQLRWFRTTLLGRIPGWSPPVRAVGPWQPVRLERRRGIDVLAGDALPRLDPPGPAVDVELTLRLIADTTIRAARVHVGESAGSLSVEPAPDGSVRVHGTLEVPHAEPWWPHTHGAQPRYPARLELESSHGPISIDLGDMAFRRIDMDTEAGGFRLLVNGVPVFCRGACWTTADLVTLRGSDEELRAMLTLARDAHMSMLRVGGTMTYGDERFFELCDELGILVWQDFMFANMDYPAADDGFLAEARAEATDILAARRRFASLAACCGGSEVEQQAAMLGLPPASWTNALFAEVLPAACATAGAGVAYVRNSPTGGPLPFALREGVSHYYGIGAYLRPPDDARRAGVRFTTETLGFANVPAPVTIEAFLGPNQAPPHHPRWKARVPRDSGPGWDFDDIRDHYLALMFRVDPLMTRYADVERYLALSRVVTGEVMARTFAEWRRAGSGCGGGLVWFLRDLWAGAGWGVVDALGRPKAAWHYLRRAFAPRAVFLTDEGLEGLGVQLLNDHAEPLRGTLRLTSYRQGRIAVAEAEATIDVPARGALTLSADRLLGRFTDLTGSYRFGPLGHDVVIAELCDATGEIVGRDAFLPSGLPAAMTDGLTLSGRLVSRDDRGATIELTCNRFAYAVAIDAGGWTALDDFVIVPPGGVTAVRLEGPAGRAPTSVEATALNGGRCRIRLGDDA
jgi:beta-mannosidase